ncbi:MAG: hypothetical protein RID93_32565, partial [Sandaracinaceae bacterium]
MSLEVQIPTDDGPRAWSVALVAIVGLAVGLGLAAWGMETERGGGEERGGENASAADRDPDSASAAESASASASAAESASESASASASESASESAS